MLRIKRTVLIFMTAALLLTGGALAGVYAVQEIQESRAARAAYVAEDEPVALSEMVVCASVLDIYGNPSFSGSPITVKQKGDKLLAATDDGLVYRIYTTSGIYGYCRGSGLLYADTKTAVKLPVRLSARKYREETTVPVDDPERPGEYEIVYGEEKTEILKSELADVNEYAYRKMSPLTPCDEPVLVQRDVLEKLDHAGSSLVSAGLSLCIESGYSLTEPSELSSEEVPLSVKTGALMKITCVNSAGSRVSAASNVYTRNALTIAGLVRIGESDWYYASGYDSYFEITVTSSDYVYVICE